MSLREWPRQAFRPMGLTLLLCLSACLSRPTLPEWGQRLGLGVIDTDSSPVRLHALVNTAWHTPGGAPLHLYLDGDGAPYLRENLVAANPTPASPLALDLMRQDQSPSAYLQRPCQFDMDAKCSATLWTVARYGPTVVDSMASAIRNLRHPGQHIVLIGYSGGGTLAMLLAARLDRVDAVITVAGNLDVGRWTAFHHYTPLGMSFDPAQTPPLPPGIRQIHWAGAKDQNVLADWTRQEAIRQGARWEVLEGVDHGCCWVSRWPALLSESLDADGGLPAQDLQK